MAGFSKASANSEQLALVATGANAISYINGANDSACAMRQASR